MMINKRLIGTVSESKKYIVGNVAVQWCSLAANMAMMTSVTGLLASLYTKEAGKDSILITVAVAAAAVIIRFGCTVVSSQCCGIKFIGNFCASALLTMSR